MEKPIDNPTLTNEQIASQYEPMRPIAFVRSFSADGVPCGVVTCWNTHAILYAIEHASASDTVKIQTPDPDIAISGRGFYQIEAATPLGRAFLEHVQGAADNIAYTDDQRLARDIADGAVEAGLNVQINGKDYGG